MGLVRALLSFFFSVSLVVLAGGMVWQRVPCARPVSLYIDSIDPRFQLSRELLERSVRRAADLWEEVLGRPLFRIDTTGKVAIRVVFDSRQQAVDELDALDSDLSRRKGEHDQVVRLYDEQREGYEAARLTLERRAAAFGQRRSAYEQQVAEVNARGGATELELGGLNRERTWLETEAGVLQGEQQRLRGLADRLNQLVTEERQLVPGINAGVETFNDIVGTLGEEYQAGLYTRNDQGEKIDVYVFESEEQLTRLLTHEMGHALGLGHIADPTAVMHAVNQSEVATLSPGDREALQDLCRWSEPSRWLENLLGLVR
jgi:hypothetical protein